MKRGNPWQLPPLAGKILNSMVSLSTPCIFLLPALLASFVSQGGEPTPANAKASYLWVEEPKDTNFNVRPKWDILSEKSAFAVTPDRAAPESPFIEYQMDVPAPGGEMELWGRTYDPAWSSSARWRLDDGAWQEWKPGLPSDSQVFNKVFVMKWCPWGKLKVEPGRHLLRIELTGPRPQDKEFYFVIDAMLLAKGAWQPKGATKPDSAVKESLALLEAKLRELDKGGEDFMSKGAGIARRCLEDDCGAIDEFAALYRDVDRALELQSLLEKGRLSKLHGRISSIKWEAGRLRVDSEWSRPFEGKLWIGLEQGRALYCAAVEKVGMSRAQSVSISVPANLPEGEIVAHCIPIGEQVADMATSSFKAPQELLRKDPQAYAWGVYREPSSLRMHPWNVSEGGMMRWDGEPYIPVGGMMNTKSTWTTHAGDQRKPSLEILKSQLSLLRSHGIKDIYYNAFFVRANPDAMADVVAATEEAGMRYGLEVSSVPEPRQRSKGFMPGKGSGSPVPAGATSFDARAPLGESELRPPHRCLWALLDQNGKMIEKGIGDLCVEPAKPDKSSKKKAKSPQQELAMEIKFSSPALDGSRLWFSCEQVLPASEPSGFLEGVDEYFSKLKTVYGSLPLGPGMRLWLDPFQNEFHGLNRAISEGELFRKNYEHFLFDKYGDIASLNKAWAAAGAPVPDLKTAVRLAPLAEDSGLGLWMDPEGGAVYSFSDSAREALRDLSRYKGMLAEELVSRAADTLKTVADVPVILKHNCWFSDWFVNPRKAGGQDGLGFESYCYGDSLAYHNSLTPFAEALSSGRRQWTLETETSPAAFDGQKDYVGALDRLQMLYDFDLMTMLGAKGIFTFGFSFDPPNRFQVTELIRDTRQLEWLTTYSKMLEAAAPRLANYLPEVYGWYPASMRERQLVGQGLLPYEMDGHYFGNSGQIRMAPDGRWIIPASRPDAGWKGLLVPSGLLSADQKDSLLKSNLKIPVWLLGSQSSNDSNFPEAWAKLPLDGFTANGIGAIPREPLSTLRDFREKVLGYRIFQTSDINGQSLPDGRLMVWTCVEKEKALLRIPSGATAVNLQGRILQTPSAQDGVCPLTLVRPPYEKAQGELPVYLKHCPGGYYYPDMGQPEVAILSGTTIERLLELNPPARLRWLPSGAPADSVTAWIEAENPVDTNFVQPRLEGYSRYSEGAAIGINSFFVQPEGKKFFARYKLNTGEASSRVWVRRMDRPAMDLEIWLDGKLSGIIGASESLSDAMHLNPWNAGTGLNDLKVGWLSLEIPGGLPPGAHSLEIVACQSKETQKLEADSKLIGGQQEKDVVESANAMLKKLQCVQIDAIMLSR